MYLRPNDLGHTFIVERRTTGLNGIGRPESGFKAVGEVRGVLASATPREIERWGQPQHPTTHTVIAADLAATRDVRIGDRLVLGSRRFHVWGADDVASLGAATIYHVEETNDSHG